MYGLAVALGLWTLLMIKLFTPSLWSIALGFVFGLAVVRKWVHNRNHKAEHGEKVGRCRLLHKQQSVALPSAHYRRFPGVV